MIVKENYGEIVIKKKTQSQERNLQRASYDLAGQIKISDTNNSIFQPLAG